MFPKPNPRFASDRPSFARRSSRGYILLTLILFIALLIIAALAIAPAIIFQVKRDREEEMIHRGVQYSRAIKKYVKKTGRYPSRLEDLEKTNEIRFLRKRYKDPITGKDFKLLHQGEVKTAFGAGIAGANPLAGVNGLNGGVAGAQALQNQLAQATQAVAAQGAGPNGQVVADAGDDATVLPNQAGGQTIVNGQSGQGGQNVVGGQPGQPGTLGQAAGTNSPFGAQVFGGGPIIGVASTSKAKSIRVFNKKDHYNDWQFIYDPSSDRGGLLNTPAQPALQGSTNLNGAQQNGQPGAGPNGNNSSPFGQPNGNNTSPFGAPGNGPNQGPSTPQTTPTDPQPQQ